MLAHDFKARFIRQVRSDPAYKDWPEMVAELSTFVSFDKTFLSSRGVDAASATFLSDVGLPHSASPFAAFSAFSGAELDEMHRSGIPPRYLPIGEGAPATMIALDAGTGEVHLVGYDGKAPQFVSSTVLHMAETICLMNDHLQMKQTAPVVAKLEKVDPRAAQTGAFWREAAEDIAAFNAQ